MRAVTSGGGRDAPFRLGTQDVIALREYPRAVMGACPQHQPRHRVRVRRGDGGDGARVDDAAIVGVPTWALAVDAPSAAAVVGERGRRALQYPLVMSVRCPAGVDLFAFSGPSQHVAGAC